MSTSAVLLPWTHLDAVLAVVAGWLVVGAIGVAALERLRLVSRVLFPLGGALGVVLAGVALAAVFASAEVAVLTPADSGAMPPMSRWKCCISPLVRRRVAVL